MIARIDLPSFVAAFFHRNLTVRFVLIGILNTSVSYTIFAALLFIGVGINLGSLLTIIAGVLFGYLTQGSIVFRYRSKSAFARFVIVWVVIYLCNVTLINLAMRMGVDRYAAVAIATVPTVIVSFFLQKYAVFRSALPTRLPRE